MELKDKLYAILNEGSKDLETEVDNAHRDQKNAQIDYDSAVETAERHAKSKNKKIVRNALISGASGVVSGLITGAITGNVGAGLAGAAGGAITGGAASAIGTKNDQEEQKNADDSNTDSAQEKLDTAKAHTKNMVNKYNDEVDAEAVEAYRKSLTAAGKNGRLVLQYPKKDIKKFYKDKAAEIEDAKKKAPRKWERITEETYTMTEDIDIILEGVNLKGTILKIKQGIANKRQVHATKKLEKINGKIDNAMIDHNKEHGGPGIANVQTGTEGEFKANNEKLLLKQEKARNDYDKSRVAVDKTDDDFKRFLASQGK